jgi:hypothetical protein
MLKHIALFVFVVGALTAANPALAADECATAVLSPDKTSLSILFNDLSVDGDTASAECTISVPLTLPAGQSLGVYRVDYRGYAMLEKKDVATLRVDYGLGPKGKGRQFKRSVRGEIDDDFSFTENIGAGLMKRVGCGEDARLNVSTSLTLKGKGESLATMDSSDGASKRGLVYRFDLKKC